MPTPEQIDRFFAFLYRGALGEWVFRLELVSGFFTALFGAALIVIAFKIREYYVPKRKEAEQPPDLEPDAEEEFARKTWQDVLQKLESPSASDWNIAIIRADAIVDGILKEMDLPGETMAERLKALDPAKLTSFHELWDAHLLRNRIVHETEQVVSREEARFAVNAFGKALKELAYLPGD